MTHHRFDVVITYRRQGEMATFQNSTLAETPDEAVRQALSFAGIDYRFYPPDLTVTARLAEDGAGV